MRPLQHTPNGEKMDAKLMFWKSSVAKLASVPWLATLACQQCSHLICTTLQGVVHLQPQHELQLALG